MEDNGVRSTKITIDDFRELLEINRLATKNLIIVYYDISSNWLRYTKDLLVLVSHLDESAVDLPCLVGFVV